MKRMGAVESDSVKSARKAKDKLYKTCERASETREQTLHGQERSRMRMASMIESRDSVRFVINTQVQSHALLCQGCGTSVPFIGSVMIWEWWENCHHCCYMSLVVYHKLISYFTCIMHKTCGLTKLLTASFSQL